LEVLPSSTSGTSNMSRWLWPIVSVLSLVLIATAVLPCLPVNWWWVRIGDFPRLQLIAIYAISIPIVLMFWKRRYSRLLACGLLMGIGIQVY
jgi:hypothetical protein